MTPTIVALCGNSSVYDGRLSKYVSTREGIASEIDPRFTRHGMANGPFYSILDYISYLSKMPMLLRPRTQREMVGRRQLRRGGGGGAGGGGRAGAG